MRLNQTETRPVVWIVDPQQWPRANLRALLIDRGFDAVGFMELERALTALNDPYYSKPGIIVLELHDLLPKEGEVETLARLPISLIALGGAMEFNQEWINKVKWKAVIRRPVRIGQIVETIAKLLNVSPCKS